MEPNAEVGQRIAKAREFLGLTQAVIAEKLGLARTTQVAIEQGRRPVSVAELYRYSEVLSRPLDYFLGLGVWGKADFRPQFRLMADRLDASASSPPRRPGRPKGPAEASPERLVLMRFEGLCRNYLELEEVNGLPRAAMPELPRPGTTPRSRRSSWRPPCGPTWTSATPPSATSACGWRTRS